MSSAVNPDSEPLVPRLPQWLIRPPGSPLRALGFRLPTLPGVPDTDSILVRAVRCAAEAPTFAELPPAEVEAVLGSLAEAVSRAGYHRLRFDGLLEQLKARREALGGPAVADWHAVPAANCEAIAFIGALRTAVDILVYIAARRAGKSESTADSWDASQVIAPRVKPGDMAPTRYDVPEVLAIRARQPWFDDLNDYRNAVYHRGFTGESPGFGFYSRSDTTREAKDPAFNAMLLPDKTSIRGRLRPHQWTYAEGVVSTNWWTT